MMISQDDAEKILKRIFPRACTYTDIWNELMSGKVKPDDRNNRKGGSTLRNLTKNNKAKQITTGFYCWIPN